MFRCEYAGSNVLIRILSFNRSKVDMMKEKIKIKQRRNKVFLLSRSKRANKDNKRIKRRNKINQRERNRSDIKEETLRSCRH